MSPEFPGEKVDYKFVVLLKADTCPGPCERIAGKATVKNVVLDLKKYKSEDFWRKSFEKKFYSHQIGKSTDPWDFTFEGGDSKAKKEVAEISASGQMKSSKTQVVPGLRWHDKIDVIVTADVGVEGKMYIREGQ